MSEQEVIWFNKDGLTVASTYIVLNGVTTMASEFDWTLLIKVTRRSYYRVSFTPSSTWSIGLFAGGILSFFAFMLIGGLFVKASIALIGSSVWVEHIPELLIGIIIAGVIGLMFFPGKSTVYRFQFRSMPKGDAQWSAHTRRDFKAAKKALRRFGLRKYNKVVTS